jgi:hypothetical protein
VRSLCCIDGILGWFRVENYGGAKVAVIEQGVMVEKVILLLCGELSIGFRISTSERKVLK